MLPEENMTRITGAHRRDDTIQRLGGQGDNWYPTVGADGSLYLALCDGSGFPGMRRAYYNSRLIRAEGSPETGVTFHDVPGYPDLSRGLREAAPENPPTRYYGFGTLSVDGTIYQYLNTWNVPTTPENIAKGTLRFVGAKLIYSPDGGTTWHNHDGSTPVHWETWDEQSADNQVFFHEPGESFSLHNFLQMGRDYELNTDGYAYVYAPNGNEEGTMNQLVMFRVPKDRILDRGAYEYFVKRNDDGSATWSPDIADRGVVHTFPSGWVNVGVHPYAWQANVTYNPGLGVYMMGNWATGLDEQKTWFGQPSYMSLLQSPTPWGPWEEFYEDDHWTPGGDENARCYQPVIIPNWIAEDGKSFWLVWTDFQEDHEADAVAQEKIAANPDLSDDELAALKSVLRPHYAFNVQKVELTTE
jgi:hypothetical protein